jgi:hypothetical protein
VIFMCFRPGDHRTCDPKHNLVTKRVGNGHESISSKPPELKHCVEGKTISMCLIRFFFNDDK